MREQGCLIIICSLRSVIRSTYIAANCHRFRDKLIKTSDKYVCFVTSSLDRCTTILDKKHESSYLDLFILQFFFSILLPRFALLKLGTRCSVVQIILKGCSPASLCFKQKSRPTTQKNEYILLSFQTTKKGEAARWQPVLVFV